jgi:hypothetical protein
MHSSSSRRPRRKRPPSLTSRGSQCSQCVLLLLSAGVLFCLILAFGGLGRHLPPSRSKVHSQRTAHQSSSSTLLPAQPQDNLGVRRNPRLAILLPFVGAEWPSYAALMCTTAVGMRDVADLIIVYTNSQQRTDNLDSDPNDPPPIVHIPRPCQTAPNIKLIHFPSTRHFMELVVTRLLERWPQENDSGDTPRKDYPWPHIPKQQFIDFMAQHTDRFPYTLVEYKPALGHILADYLPTDVYSHWAYSDWDVLWGDVGRHLTVDDWTQYDVLTWGFGDQRRLYLRGQFTMHRNDPERINQLWRACHYLSRIDERYARMLREDMDFVLESAEGCYSVAVLSDPTLSVKYATAAWTDISANDTASRSGVYVIRDTAQQRHLLIKRDDTDEFLAGVPSIGSYASLAGSPIYRDESLPWREPIGAMEPVQDLPSSWLSSISSSHLTFLDQGGGKEGQEEKQHDGDSCHFFWIRPVYRNALCLPSTIAADDNLYWVNGKLYKQGVAEMTVQTGLATAPLFHFQEWKRHYQAHHLTAVLDPSWTSFLLSREGGIPVLHEEAVAASGLRKRVQALSGAPWRWPRDLAVMGEQTRSSDVFPDFSYCLWYKMDHRGQLTCHDRLYWSDTQRINLLTSASGWKLVEAEGDVTLCLAVAIRDLDFMASYAKLIQNNLNSWQGQPAVIIVSFPQASRSQLDNAWDELENALQMYDATALVVVIWPAKLPNGESESETTGYIVSDKALLNMAVDLSPTRWYVTGLDLDRGLILNRDSVVLALRAVSTSVRSGRVFWLAQYALNDNPLVGLQAESLSLHDLALAQTHSVVQPSWQIDEPCDEDGSDTENNSMTALNTLWWSLSKTMLDSEQNSISRTEIMLRAQRIEEINRQILSQALTMGNAANSEPSILLVDNLGPHTGARVHTLIRGSESFYGIGCAGARQLTMMIAAGYQVDVLEGAFAVSSAETRIKKLTCEGCLAWKGHQEIMAEMIRMEMRRIVNTAIVWENPRIE